MTNEHLRTLLDDEEDTRLLHCAAQQLADAAVPEPVLAGLRVMTERRRTRREQPLGKWNACAPLASANLTKNSAFALRTAWWK